jgi:hypothetical protein
MDRHNNAVQAPRKSGITKLREQQVHEMQAIIQKYELNERRHELGMSNERFERNPVKAEVRRIKDLMREISSTMSAREEIDLSDDGVSLAKYDV